VLSQLPLTFARVSNFLGAEKDDEPVKGGVDKPGQGCLECHGRDDQFPQSTLPFPWVAITPTPSPTPLATPTPSTTRSEGTSYLEPAQPANISTTPNEQVFAPPVSGTAGEIMVTYRDPDQPDHSSLYVGEQRRDGSVAYYRTGTDDNHHVLLWIATDVTKLTFFKGFDTSGAPDAGAGESIVSEVAHVSGTERVPNIPSSGPAIVAARLGL
jgi:hypothetical protein